MDKKTQALLRSMIREEIEILFEGKSKTAKEYANDIADQVEILAKTWQKISELWDEAYDNADVDFNAYLGGGSSGYFRKLGVIQKHSFDELNQEFKSAAQQIRKFKEE